MHDIIIGMLIAKLKMKSIIKLLLFIVISFIGLLYVSHFPIIGNEGSKNQ